MELSTGRRRSPAEAERRASQLQWALLATIESAQRIDSRQFEARPHAEICGEHLPEVRALIMDAVAVFNTVIAHYEREAEVPAASDSGVFHSVFEDIVETAAGGEQQIADVAFMARWELIRKLDGLVVADRLESWELIAACSSAVRRVIKAICGVERVLADVERLPSALADLYQTRLDEALAIRGEFVWLVAQLRSLEAQRQQFGTTRCVRLVGTAIASLIGRPVYESLRIEDRRTLRTLQQRALVWLRAGEDPREGDELLSDVSALAGLLLEINRRPELVAHDRGKLEQLLEQLRRPFGEWIDLQADLAAVRGRDPEFDALADAGASLEQLRAAATTVLASLGPA